MTKTREIPDQLEFDRLLFEVVHAAIGHSQSQSEHTTRRLIEAEQRVKAVFAAACAAILAPAQDTDLAAQLETALAAERERLCAAIKAADDESSGLDYMLDSDDCISVIRGTWIQEKAIPTSRPLCVQQIAIPTPKGKP